MHLVSMHLAYAMSRTPNYFHYIEENNNQALQQIFYKGFLSTFLVIVDRNALRYEFKLPESTQKHGHATATPTISQLADK